MAHISALDELESEAIYILRETFAQFERPVILFSGGKDSIVVSWLAKKALLPGELSIPLLHIDTGHNFPETLAFRDDWATRLGAPLLVRFVQDSIDSGRVQEETGPGASRNSLQSVTLVDALAELGADAAIGGARRDEEKARAKERVFSHRDASSRWQPHAQRPELWSLYNGAHLPGEHFRVFPLSHWTERDIWRYIQREGLPLPSLYFAHERAVFCRAGTLLAASAFVPLFPGEKIASCRVRFRTVGDMTCTGAVESNASTLEEIIAEIEAARTSERGTRADDRRSDAAMEERKRAGYF